MENCETFPWTVYCDGEVVDIATDKEAGELLKIFKTVHLQYETGVIVIVD